MKIALDAMGGDNAPDEPVYGAVEAVRENPDLSVVLTGDQEVLESVLEDLEYPSEQIDIKHAPDVIGMEEKGAESIRKKEGSSINVCIQQVTDGDVEAIVSAGNTGATVAASTLQLGLLEGVHRPGIALPLSKRGGYLLLIDAGANIYCKPEHLLQYAVMASVYLSSVQRVEDPRVGLLNIGEEESKGNQLVRETLPLLKNAPINFAGNVEGQDLFDGNIDVVVSEGFLGNVLLKTLEGWSQRMFQFMSEMVKENMDKEGQAAFEESVAPVIQEEIDYADLGGAPLLGLNSVCIISHGRSTRKAFRNAISVAARYRQQQINDQIVQALQETDNMLQSVKT